MVTIDPCYQVPESIIRLVDEQFLTVINADARTGVISFAVPSARRIENSLSESWLELDWFVPGSESMPEADDLQFELYYDSRDSGRQPIDVDDSEDLVCYLEDLREALAY